MIMRAVWSAIVAAEFASLTSATHYDAAAWLDADTYSVSVKIDVDDDLGRTTLSVQGPDSVWFGVGFGQTTMDGSWAIVIDDSGSYDTRVLGYHTEGSPASDEVTVDRELVKSSIREVTFYRPNTGDDFTFPAADGAALDVILAVGNSSSWIDSGHIHRSSQTVQFESSDMQSTFAPDQDCSALSAYVSVQQPSLLYSTLTSAEALWDPYSYSLGRTMAVHVDCETLCNRTLVDLALETNGTELSQLVDGNIVMVERGDCTEERCREHQKVYNAEKLGAVAVLIYNNEGYNSVEELEEDSGRNNNIETSIPVRMITQSDGLTLASYAEQAAANDSKESVEISIGCFDNDFPADICVIEYGTEADSWKLDGTYQQLSRDEDGDRAVYNDHPVWRKEGYKNFLRDRFIWINDDLDWVISGVDTGRMDRAQAICVDDSGFINEPSKCRLWIEPGNSNEDILTINVTDSVCDGSDAKFCLQSDNSALSGLQGTYEQVAENAPYWTRDIDDTDMAPGLIYWYENRAGDRFRFELEDTIDGQIIAYCNTEDESIRLSPNDCPQWWVIQDGSTENDDYNVDDSLTFEDGYCEGEIIIPDPSPPDAPTPEFLCMTDHSINHVFLEGEYSLMSDLVTKDNNRSIWINERLDGSYLPAYMYFAGGYSQTNYPYWIIANELPNEQNEGSEMSGVGVYAYCPSNTELPTECQSCWYFYYNDGFDADCEAELTDSMCATTTAPNEGDYTQQMCLSFDDGMGHDNEERDDSSEAEGRSRDSSSDDDNSGNDSDSDSDEDSSHDREKYLSEDMKRLTGTWELNDPNDKQDGRVYWVHTEYDRNDRDRTFDRVMYYDGVFRYWMIGTNFSQSYFYCTEYELFDPSECEEWKYWNGSIVDGLQLSNNVTCDELNYVGSEDDKNGDGSNSDKEAREAANLAIILSVIAVVVFGAAGVFYYNKRKENNQSGRNNNSSRVGRSDENAMGAHGQGYNVPTTRDFGESKRKKTGGGLAQSDGAAERVEAMGGVKASMKTHNGHVTVPSGSLELTGFDPETVA